MAGPRAGRSRCQRVDLAQAERGGERVADARVGHVGVGVRGEQRDTGPDQGRHHAPAGGRLGDRVRAAQEQGMVRDQQLGATRRLGGDGGRRIDREQDVGHGGVQVTDREAHRVPRLRPGRREACFENGDAVTDRRTNGGHPRDPTRMVSRRSAGRVDR